MEKVNAMIHSLGRQDTVSIVVHINNNNVLAKYKGNYYTAIFNPFVCLYYVDDKYGKLSKEDAEIRYGIKL